MSGCYAVFHKQLGDTLLLEPALARLREFHDGPVHLITRRGHEPLVALMDGVIFQRGLPLVWRGDLYCYDPLNKSAFRAIITPASEKRCILPDSQEMRWYHQPLFGHHVIVPGLGDDYVARYFWQHTPAPTDGEFRPPRLRQPHDSCRPPGFADAPYILVNPTSGWRKKSWVPDRWAALIRHLHAATGIRFVMTGGAIDWQLEHCRAITELAGPAVSSLASGTTLAQFLWLCSRASVVLTVDGAASHLAAAFGVKNLTLFGPTSIHNWHYPTAHSVALQAPLSKDGIARVKNLSTESVIAAAERLI